MRPAATVVAAILPLVFSTLAQAAPVTACAVGEFCYCINADLQSAIDRNIEKIRRVIAEQRALSKAMVTLIRQA